MIQKVFSVKDVKVGGYLKPFFVRSHGEAERAFMDTVNDPGTVLYKHPEDYQLYYLGEYDDEDGLFHTVSPQHIINGQDIVAKGEDDARS